MQIIYTVITMGVSGIPKTDLVLSDEDANYTAEERAIRAAIAGNSDTDSVLVSSQRTASVYSTLGYSALAVDGTSGGTGSASVFLVVTTTANDAVVTKTIFSKTHVRADGAIAWSSGTAYVVDDTALRSSHTYRSLDSNTNQDPTGAGAAHWVLDDATPAEWAVHIGVLDALAAVYDGAVTYNSRDHAYETGHGSYECIQDGTVGLAPHSNPGNWQSLHEPYGESILPIGGGPITISL
jgi:hypothetical protein